MSLELAELDLFSGQPRNARSIEGWWDGPQVVEPGEWRVTFRAPGGVFAEITRVVTSWNVAVPLSKTEVLGRYRLALTVDKSKALEGLLAEELKHSSQSVRPLVIHGSESN